jgi:hypothetical protein
MPAAMCVTSLTALLGLLLLGSLAACRASETRAPKAELSPAQELLARSLAFHDPHSTWGREPMLINWTSTRPDGAIGYVFEVEFAANGDFSLAGERAGKILDYHVENGVVRASVDGAEAITDEVRKQMGLARDGGLFWHDYLGFLGSFPMNLPGADARIDDEVTETELDGSPVLAFDMRFAPEIGHDTYTFYFEAGTARLVGCRFYREDPAQDGETILFEGEVRVGELRLPRTRRWYTNLDDRFLGTDEISAGE